MREIKHILEEKIQHLHLLPRRFGIKKGKNILFGPPKSGKTSLSLFISKTLKNTIYIDCIDPRNDIDNLKNQILKSFLEKKIDLLILDNYKPIFILPNIENILIVLNSKQIPSDDLQLQNFSLKSIMPLTFEEYIGFSNSSEDINQLFNRFIKDGNSPEMLHSLEFQKISKKQNNMKLFFQEDYDLFTLLLQFQSQKITVNQFYTYSKRFLKVSKDKVYALLTRLQNNHFIFLIPCADSINKTKKLYFYDFSLPYAHSPNPNFQAIFENMVFLELYSQYQEQIFYRQNAHFCINETIFFAIPFPNQQNIDTILKNNPYKKIIIIAINKIQKSQCQVIDFVSFALKEYVD